METKIDRGFFNTQKAYEKMLGGKIYESAQHEIIGFGRPICESIDEKGYNVYVVVKCKDGSEKIESGWEFSEDANDRKNELKEDGIQSKSVSRRYLKSVGLDPSDDSNWFKGNVGVLSERKNESTVRHVALRVKDIFESIIIEDGQQQQTQQNQIQQNQQQSQQQSQQVQQNQNQQQVQQNQAQTQNQAKQQIQQNQVQQNQVQQNQAQQNSNPYRKPGETDAQMLAREQAAANKAKTEMMNDNRSSDEINRDVILQYRRDRKNKNTQSAYSNPDSLDSQFAKGLIEQQWRNYSRAHKELDDLSDEDYNKAYGEWLNKNYPV